MESQLATVEKHEMFLDEKAFEFAMRVANVFAKSTMVPDQFKNNIGNCMIALNYASRVRADPFMIMQNMYVVQGRPGIEGKLIIALINQSGRFEPLEFDEGPDFCVAHAKDIKSGKVLNGTKITMDMVKTEGWLSKKGSKWQTMPGQMFRYRSAAFFARTYCPEVLLGMQTKEELDDVYIETKREPNGSYAAKSTGQKVVDLKSIIDDATPLPVIEVEKEPVKEVEQENDSPAKDIEECPDDGKKKTMAECEKCDQKKGCPAHS